jgi:uncharacterized membrane protein
MKTLRIAMRVTLSVALIGLLVSCFQTLFRVIWIGQLWATAPIFTTVFVAVVLPAVLLIGSAFILILTWSKL